MKTYSFVSREIRKHVSGMFAWKLYKFLRMLRYPRLRMWVWS